MTDWIESNIDILHQIDVQRRSSWRSPNRDSSGTMNYCTIDVHVCAQSSSVFWINERADRMHHSQPNMFTALRLRRRRPPRPRSRRLPRRRPRPHPRHPRPSSDAWPHSRSSASSPPHEMLRHAGRGNESCVGGRWAGSMGERDLGAKLTCEAELHLRHELVVIEVAQSAQHVLRGDGGALVFL